MEYSVHDLVRILLKRWYVIFLAMLVFGGLSVITARSSYHKAVADYESYTGEKVVESFERGNMLFVYQIDCKMTDMNRYISKTSDKLDFIDNFAAKMREAGYDFGGAASIYQEAEAAYADFSTVLGRLLTDSVVLQKVRTDATTAGYAEPDGDTAEPDELKYLTVELLDDNMVRVTVSDMDMQSCRSVMNAYISALKDVGETNYLISVNAKEVYDEFLFTDDPSYYEIQLASKVMQPPEYSQTLVKTVGTAAACAFVFICFIILLITFVQDCRAQRRETGDEQGDS